MVQISIPINPSGKTGAGEYFTFNVKPLSVMLAGSRNLELSREYCNRIVGALHKRGFGFVVGCASGVDQSFRKVLAFDPFSARTFMACAFPNRTKRKYSFGLYASVVVPEKIPVPAALARRTIWMVRRCQFLVLFPDDPNTGNWGKGSRLAFKTAILNLKPVFVHSEHKPPYSRLYNIFSTTLFDVIPGFWVVPHTYKLEGTCEDEG